VFSPYESTLTLSTFTQSAIAMDTPTFTTTQSSHAISTYMTSVDTTFNYFSDLVITEDVSYLSLYYGKTVEIPNKIVCSTGGNTSYGITIIDGTPS
jgi:hypothetical protein